MDNDRLDQPTQEYEDVELVDGNEIALNALRRAQKHPAFIAVIPFVLAFAMKFIPMSQDRLMVSPLYIAALVLFGALMITGTVREFKGNRRLLWLATWLAASISSVTTLFWEIIHTYTTYAHIAPSYSSKILLSTITNTFDFAVLVTAGLWASYNYPKLRRVVMYGFYAVIPSIVWQFMFVKSGMPEPIGYWLQWGTVFGSIAIIGKAIVWVAVALRVFATRDNTDVYTGALFLYTLTALHLVSGRPDTGYLLSFLAFRQLWIPTAAILVFALVQNHRIKLRALATALVIPIIWSAFYTHDWMSLLGWGLYILIYAGRITLFPRIANFWLQREAVETAS